MSKVEKSAFPLSARSKYKKKANKTNIKAKKDATHAIKASRQSQGKFDMRERSKRKDALTVNTETSDIMSFHKLGLDLKPPHSPSLSDDSTASRDIPVRDTNLVARCWLQFHDTDQHSRSKMTLDKIKSAFCGAYAKRAFPSVSVVLNYPAVTISITSNGKICVSGAKDFPSCATAIWLFVSSLRILFGVKLGVIDMRIVNRSAHGRVDTKGKVVNLSALNKHLISIFERSEYNKFFPGLRWKLDKSHYSAVYKSGEFLIVGSVTDKEMPVLEKKVREVIKMFLIDKNEADELARKEKLEDSKKKSAASKESVLSQLSFEEMLSKLAEEEDSNGCSENESQCAIPVSDPNAVVSQMEDETAFGEGEDLIMFPGFS
jgi:TATA-box binding protein (TBP) (component of TFIID and TFIIIB)